MKMFCRVYEIERRVKTEDKYLFPCYETLHWYKALAGFYPILKVLVQVYELLTK